MLLKAIVSLAGGGKLEMKQPLFSSLKKGWASENLNQLRTVFPVQGSVATDAKNHNVKKILKKA